MYEEPRGVFAPAGNTWAAVQGQKINGHGGNDWFWKSNITGYMSVSDIVDSHINTLVPRYTNFILNCPPNDKGLLDDAIVTELAQVGTYRTVAPRDGAGRRCRRRGRRTATRISRSARPRPAARPPTRSTARTTWASMRCGSRAAPCRSGSRSTSAPMKSAGFLGYLPPYQAGSGFNSSTGKCSGTQCSIPATTGLITGYEIDTSTDGTTFTKADDRHLAGNGKLQGVNFGPVQARYVRLIATAVNSGTSAAATEIEVGGPQTLTVPTPTTSQWGH